MSSAQTVQAATESAVPIRCTAAFQEHPLGPVLLRTAGGRHGRARAAIVLAVCIVVMLLAAWLRPDPSGMGTHRQLGFLPCGLVIATGIPCPTCGMTTAFAWMARGHIRTAFAAQPFGATLALAAAASAGLALAALVSGRAWRVNWYRVSPGWVAATIAVSFVAAWLYKVIVVVAAGSG